MTLAGDILLDPATGDYVPGPGGEWLRDETCRSQAYRAIATELGGWWGDATWGSELHLLGRETRDAEYRQRIERRVRAALRPLVEEGRVAEEMAFEHDLDSAGRPACFATITDRTAGRLRLGPLPLPVVP